VNYASSINVFEAIYNNLRSLRLFKAGIEAKIVNREQNIFVARLPQRTASFQDIAKFAVEEDSRGKRLDVELQREHRMVSYYLRD
jgi:hypothetical protein